MRSNNLKRHTKLIHGNDEAQSESDRESNSTEKCANEHEQLSENDFKSYDGSDVDPKIEFELQRDRDVYLGGLPCKSTKQTNTRTRKA